MKKAPFILLPALILLVVVSTSYAIQITYNSYGDWAPQINNNGYVVWEGYDGPDAEIYLYDGTSVFQLTNNSDGDSGARINNNGYVVWQGYDGNDSEIFLYDGKSITNISNNTYHDYCPQINDNGYVVWVGIDESDYNRVLLYDGTSVVSIHGRYKDYAIGCPQINNSGYITWEEFDGSDNEIMLYDGMSVKQLTKNYYYDYEPQINEDGYVVWMGGEWPNSEIYLYTGVDIINISYNSYGNILPQINDSGYVVWEGIDNGTDTDIFLYDGTSTRKLTKNSFDDNNPKINNNGYIVWEGSVGPLDYTEIFLYNGKDITQLTKNAYYDSTPQINDSDYVVWSGSDGSDYEIFLSTIVTLLLPNGREVISSGATYNIQWRSPPEATKFKLMYSYDNGVTWLPIKNADDLKETSFNWQVPVPWGNKKQCLVKVIGYNSSGRKVGSDKSDEPFTIEVVKLTSPNEGTLTCNSPLNITWQTNKTKRPIAKIRIYYTCNGGITWNLIGKSKGNNPGTFPWTPVCSTPKNCCKVKIVLLDESGNILGQDTSDSCLILQP